MKNILLLDWSSEWRQYVMDTLIDMDINVFLVMDRHRDVTQNVKDIIIIDDLYHEPLNHIDEIMNWIKNKKIDGVFTTEDELVMLSNQIALNLNLKSNTNQSIENCINKYKTRKLFQTNDSDIYFKKINNFNDLKNCDFPFPYIIKPLSGSFSTGVSLICNEYDKQKAYNLALEASKDLPILNNEFLLEKYIKSNQSIYTVEVAVQNKHIFPIISTEEVQFSILDENNLIRFCYDYVIVPSRLTKFEVDRLFMDAIKRIHKLDFNNCVLHLEYKKDEEDFKLIEINPRPIGGMVPVLIKKLFNIDLIKIAVMISIGYPIDTYLRKADFSKYGLIKYITNVSSGKIMNIENMDSISTLNNCIYCKLNFSIGDWIEFADNLGIAVLMFECNTTEDIKQLNELINKTIKIRIGSNSYDK